MATLRSHVKKWYHECYPDDSLWKEIDPRVSFGDILQMMQEKKNIYPRIADDSVIRERVFWEIADLLHTDYDTVFTLWLEGGTVNAAGVCAGVA